MNFEKLFLGEDIPTAKLRLRKLEDKLKWVHRLIETNDLVQARFCLNQALIEINNLVDLSKEKQGKEQLIRLANELTEIGIDPLEVLGDKHANKQN